MNKKILALAAGIGGAAAVLTEVVIHGYLDVMYAERIPQGLMKRAGNKASESGMLPLYELTEKSNEWIHTQPIETIDLKNSRGNILKGYLLMAEEESNTFVVFAHGYRSSHEGDPANFEQYYHEKGYHFLSVDHTAAGESEGDYVGFDYFEADDMLEWLNYLTERFGEDIRVILHGVSMGGATVCKMASRVPEQVKLIVSDCAYTSANDEFLSVAGGVGVKKTAPAVLKVFNALNKRLAGFDLKETDVRDSVKNAKVPMLFVHGGADDFVPTRMGYELYELCGSEKELLIVDGAPHAQSIVVNGEQYKAKLDEWLDKYL